MHSCADILKLALTDTIRESMSGPPSLESENGVRKFRNFTVGRQFTDKIFEQRHKKPGFLHMRNKDADKLRGNRQADQRLCFHYIDSTIPLLYYSYISSL